MHRCTDEEFEKFYAFEDAATSKAESFQAGGHLWCLDVAHLIQLNGSWRTDEFFGAIEAAVFTCASQVTLFDGSIQGGSEDCEWDKDKVLEYLGSGASLVTFYN